MRRRIVGPYQIVKRQGRFEIHDGSVVISRHESFLSAEERAIREWLRPKGDDGDSDATLQR
jgi:hypothetical protein